MDVGAADTRPFDLDQDLARSRRGLFVLADFKDVRLLDSDRDHVFPQFVPTGVEPRDYHGSVSTDA